jgi:TonB-linked SusC/RagA family outer membrane protein
MRKMYMLLSLFLCIQTFAQNRTISGRVTDEKNNPIANATVAVKGTQNGTTTNENGNYALTLSSHATTLVVSYIGMGEKEIELTSSDRYDVSLSTKTKDLQEVVVVGYGTQRRANVTASIATVKAADIEDRPYTSIDQMLEGKVPGLQAPLSTGQPGANQEVTVRGSGSIFAGTSPLYVVDGLIINTGDLTSNTTTANALAGLNPNDVESITILKDAQATSIYGSRGSNGVIIITTKRGHAGKTQFRADAEIGANKLADLPANARFLNTTEYILLLKEGVINAGGTPQDAEDIAQEFGEGSGANSDWKKLVTRNGQQQQYNLSVSGGDIKNQFYASAGYFNQQATVIASDFKRYSFRVNYKHVASDKLSFTFNLNGSNSMQHAPTNSGFFSNPVGSLPFLRPTQNPYNPDGTLDIVDFNNGNYNPLYIAKYDINRLNTTLVQGLVGAEYSILKNLKFSSHFGIDFNYLEEYNYLNQFHGDGAGSGGIALPIDSRFFNWIATNQLDYTTAFNANSKLRLDAKLGYEAQKNKAYVLATTSEGFPPTNDLYLSVNAATPTLAKASGSDYDIAGVYSAATLGYDGKYILSGSFRRDGSSRFSEQNRFGNFWSTGVAWNIDRESFVSNIKFISALKLRGSYGTSGNALIDNYAWRPTVHFGVNYGGQPGGVFDVVGNEKLTWESTRQSDIGLDAGFLQNRISVTFDLYNRTSDRLLFSNPLSATTGFTSFEDNIGKVENKGMELTINLTPVKTKNFTWDLSFNISHNKNKVVSLPGGKDIPNGVFRISQGRDFRSFYAREWAGVDPANGDPLWWTDSSHKQTTNVYSNAKRQFIGSAEPKYFGGLTSTFSYKGIDLETDFVYNYGNLVTDGWIFYAIDGAFPDLNKYALELQRWQKPGDITNVPRYEFGSTNNSNAFSSRFLYKGDFIRLRNVTVGYNVTLAQLKRIGINSLRIYLRGTNLWTKTYDKNLTVDPEQGLNSQSNLNVFYTKSLTAGINVGF